MNAAAVHFYFAREPRLNFRLRPLKIHLTIDLFSHIKHSIILVQIVTDVKAYAHAFYRIKRKRPKVPLIFPDNDSIMTVN